MMVVEAVIDVWGPDRVGVRISPNGIFNDMWDENPTETFQAFAKRIDQAKIAYLEVVEDSFQGNHV